MSDYGLQIFDAAGQPDFSIKGRVPRFHSTGTFLVPRFGNSVLNGAFVYIINISVPEITDPSEWWVLDVPTSGPQYQYLFNDLYSFSFSVGSVQLIIGMKQNDYVIPFKYLLVTLK